VRSTTCTEVAAGLALLVAAGPAAAAPVGCFKLASDPARLGANPADIVDSMILRIGPATLEDGMGVPPGTSVVYLSIVAAAQGHAALPMPEEDFPDGFGGVELYTALTCAQMPEGLVCGECGIPALTVTGHAPDSLDILIDDLGVGHGQACGGYIDLVPEGGVPIAYTLAAAPASACGAD
jgi:hypothetical protein